MLNFFKLNEAQRRAVTHQGGPAIVLAGPGSGKTFLIVSRIIFLIEQKNVPANTILVITFTKAAAYSMRRRFEKSTDGKYPEVWFGTFHSFFYQILREYDSYNNNSLFENEEKKQYVLNIFAQFNLEYDNSVDINKFLDNPISSMPDKMTEEQAVFIVQKIKEKIRFDRRLDFDDMGELVIQLLENNPKVLKELQSKCRYILVDEYQDTNQEQEEILSLIAAPENELMVVGDDDQAIYGFRGSKPDVMKNFKVKFPDAKTYFLNLNYRSTGKIVEAALMVINENKDRFYKALRAKAEGGDDVNTKGFENKNSELTYIACRILEMKENYQISFSDMAVITRWNREHESIALFLQKNGIPCCKKKTGKSVSEHFVVKEMLECLEFVVGKRDRAPCVWNKMGGDERKRRIIERQAPGAAMHFICNVMGYEKLLKKQAEELEKEERIHEEIWLKEWEGILNIIKEHAKQYRSPRSTLSVWIEELSFYLEKIPQERYVEGVQILTMHGSKGLEFSYVCIPDANEGIIPGKRCRKETEIEEERRLFYVAMTRAKKVLDILYLTGTPDYPRLSSRFLNSLLKSSTHFLK